ncbi:PP2C family protein-serine/threonine phosphatase [Micromonospora sp. WMMA1923]|uniref:PP2C family protein-serine/threonine phosphatase n=1 Tax=Micromonospora sp. WMMA1923 TaxID=3404125 RepID=UPI003B9436E8
MILRVAAASHLGLVRRRNEDAYHVGPNLLAVADGLGGHVAGDVASTTVIDTMKLYDRAVEASALATTLGGAISTANDALRQRVEAEPDLAGMGTTLVALLHNGTSAVLANVGDSRAYLLRGGPGDGQIVQLTEDHVYRHLVADSADVPHLPEKLARFLDGRADGRSPDLTPLTLRPEDRLLLCSDGLSSYVPHHLLHAALRAETPQDAVDQLINLALEHGGPDNVTAVVADIEQH